MKKIILTLAAIFAMAAAAQAVSIVNSSHDLSASPIGGGTTEICAYCHTPHNPATAYLLWNRVNPTAENFVFYNSASLTPSAKGASFVANSTSLFCMSCHDGVTTMGAIAAKPTTGWTAGSAITTAAAIGLGTSNNGTNLTNDHPVGFSYTNAITEDAGGLFTIAQVGAKMGGANTGILFGTSTKGPDQMECASCHKVHDKGTSGHFLRIENNKSNLCLACHNK